MSQILVTDDENAFRQAEKVGVGALDSLHYQRTRGAANYLWAAEAVDVRVIPVQAWWLVFRDSHSVFERRSARLAGSVQDIVLVTNRRDRQPMEMQVGRGQ